MSFPIEKTKERNRTGALRSSVRQYRPFPGDCSAADRDLFFFNVLLRSGLFVSIVLLLAKTMEPTAPVTLSLRTSDPVLLAPDWVVGVRFLLHRNPSEVGRSQSETLCPIPRLPMAAC